MSLSSAISAPTTVLLAVVPTGIGLPSPSTTIPSDWDWFSTGRLLRVSAYLTWLGVQCGNACRIVATAPEATAADIDVPPTRKYLPSTTQEGHRDAYWLPGASVE